MSLINDSGEASKSDGFFVFHVYSVHLTSGAPRRKAQLVLGTTARLVQAEIPLGCPIRSPMKILIKFLGSPGLSPRKAGAGLGTKALGVSRALQGALTPILPAWTDFN